MTKDNLNKESYDYIRYSCTTFFAHKWQLYILLDLCDGPKHFGELVRLNPGISKKMLSHNLKKLEGKGVINRKEYEEGSLNRVEYSLTKEGKKLENILKQLEIWGKENFNENEIEK